MTTPHDRVICDTWDDVERELARRKSETKPLPPISQEIRRRLDACETAAEQAILIYEALVAIEAALGDSSSATRRALGAIQRRHEGRPIPGAWGGKP